MSEFEFEVDEVANGNDIVLFLKAEGFEAMFPTFGLGECKKEYIVVKAISRAGVPAISTSQQLYEMICYVPREKRSELEKFVLRIERALKKLGKTMAIKSMKVRSIDFYDEDVRAHRMSTTFGVYYQNE